MLTKQAAQAQVKEFRTLYNKEGQPALKKHYERQYKRAKENLAAIVQNDSGFKVLRTPWHSLPIKPWEAT